MYMNIYINVNLFMVYLISMQMLNNCLYYTIVFSCNGSMDFGFCSYQRVVCCFVFSLSTK